MQHMSFAWGEGDGELGKIGKGHLKVQTSNIK